MSLAAGKGNDVNDVNIEEQLVKEHLRRKYELEPGQIDSLYVTLLDTLRQRMAEAGEAVNRQDLIAIGQVGHSLKGIFLHIGIAELVELAISMEQVARSGDSSESCAEYLAIIEKKLAPILL